MPLTALKNTEWRIRLSQIDYAFQPIVNIHTGNTFGFEALLRHHEKAGFKSIDEIFDQAYEEDVLHQVDLYLRRKALAKFAGFKSSRHLKLFFNLDNRLFNSRDFSSGDTLDILETYGYSIDDICFEISEKHRFHDNSDVSKILGLYRDQGYKIAVDDCGTGFSGLQMLYYAEPDYIKIDRFFIQNLENDPKKRLVVSTIVNFAHFMGALVLAEGVETRNEHYLCREIGCDMLQGFLVQRPQLELRKLRTRYEKIGEISQSEKRHGVFKDQSLISGEIKYIEPVFSDCDIIAIIDKFRNETSQPFFPVINQYEEPLGIVRETAFKEYIFSKFGRNLLENPSFGKDLSRFISRIPVADIHSSVEKLIETYTHYNSSEGLLMVDDTKYVGVLSTKALLKLINEKNLTLARNQNPLTRLPGNTMIHEYFSTCLSDFKTPYMLLYFDFDNFKPYNDKYGFRNGDRLILMFAELLKTAGFSENRFVGHVGGDDFFMGIKNPVCIQVENEMRQLALRFKKNAESFYDTTTVQKGYMTVEDRQGNITRAPLMTVSIAALTLPCGPDRSCSIEKAGNIIAILKKKAKQSSTGFCAACITDIPEFRLDDRMFLADVAEQFQDVAYCDGISASA